MKIWDKISEKNQIMWTQQVSGEQLAQRFHHEQALGAELFGGSSRQQSWKGLPQAEKQRSIEAARLTGIEMATNAEKQDDSRRYCAQPGEAEGDVARDPQLIRMRSGRSLTEETYGTRGLIQLKRWGRARGRLRVALDLLRT